MLEIVPITLEEANDFVRRHHRSHEPVPGHKFSIGVLAHVTLIALDAGPLGQGREDIRLVGVAIVGRPVARHLDNGMTLEVNRTCTDGTRNANSMLYGACRRAAFALGYRRLVTYTHAGESGTSLIAAGYRVIAERAPRPGWDSLSRPRINRNDQVQRTLWQAR